MNVVKRIAINVRNLRIQKFKTVENACQKTGVSLPRWYRLEQGKRPGMIGAVIDEVSHALGVDPVELVREPTHRIRILKKRREPPAID